MKEVILNNDCQNLPNIGDRIEWFYKPAPIVKEKLWNKELNVLCILLD